MQNVIRREKEQKKKKKGDAAIADDSSWKWHGETNGDELKDGIVQK